MIGQSFSYVNRRNKRGEKMTKEEMEQLTLEEALAKVDEALN